jgi:hypothetical protein
MQRIYQPGEAAPAGTYWNIKTFEMVQIGQEGDCLPAGNSKFVRAPLALMLLVAPLTGLAFVVFLPFAVPAIALHALGTRFLRRAGASTVPDEGRARVRR